MFVVKRSGEIEELKFDLISQRLQDLANNDLMNVCIPKITQYIASGIINMMKTSEIDELTINACTSLSTIHFLIFIKILVIHLVE